MITVKTAHTALKAAITCGVKSFIYTSSIAIWATGELAAIDESKLWDSVAETEPNQRYGILKKEATLLVQSAQGRGGMSTTIMIPHVVTGPRDGLYLRPIIETGINVRALPIGSPHGFTYVISAAEAFSAVAEKAIGTASDLQDVSGKAFLLYDFSASGLWNSECVERHLKAPPKNWSAIFAALVPIFSFVDWWTRGQTSHPLMMISRQSLFYAISCFKLPHPALSKVSKWQPWSEEKVDAHFGNYLKEAAKKGKLV